jgi:hypothetical protein
VTAALRDDYAGAFDAGLSLAGLSRAALAALGREFMMFGQLNDRVGLPTLGGKLGADAMERTAIDEWMGASPIYTRRMRRSLGFAGDDVATIMKGLQLDVGFAHQYFDVRYEVESATRGRFWLNSCGALMDVEPFGESQVISMCHHMEDPTFDATAVATNPRARVRPIHRPPRRPSERVPHCMWTITIEPDVEPIVERDLTKRIGASKLARIELKRCADAEAGGWPDYDRPFESALQLEDFSHGALVLICKELAVQNHLLVRSFMTTTTERGGAELAAHCAEQQWIGSGYVCSERLQAALGIEAGGIEAVMKTLQMHPALHPREYIDARFELLDARTGRISIGACDALEEADAASWFAALANRPAPALDAMARAVDARASCLPVAPPAGMRLAWEVAVDEGAERAEIPRAVELARISGAASFQFARWRELRG